MAESIIDLSNPKKDDLAAWEFISEDCSKILVQGVAFRAASNVLRHRIKLLGVDATAIYRFVKGRQKEEKLSGKALMTGGFLYQQSKAMMWHLNFIWKNRRMLEVREGKEYV